MASFTIDDVRETLESDITRFLARIEETATRLTDAHSAAASAVPETPTFRLIEEAGHAIYGTSSLVSAGSLATSAKLLEELGERGQRELTLAAEHSERARRIAVLVRAGAVEMRTMLDLELTNRGADAEWVALDWQEQAHELLGATNGAPSMRNGSHAPTVLVDVAASEAMGTSDVAFSFAEEEVSLDDIPLEDPEPAPVAGEEFSFEAETAAPARDAIHEELQAIFQQEARECVAALSGHLDALSTDMSDLGAARALERIYHTLKGAAATVGLEDVSDRAKVLQDRMQSVVEQGAEVTRELLGSLTTDTAALFACAGVKDVSLRRVPPSGRVAAASEARAELIGEVRAAYDEASALIEVLADAQAEQVTGVQSALGRIFHRIKGSALVVGEAGIADEAARLHALCVSGAATTGELSRGLTRIALLAGITAPATREERGSSSALVDGDARAAFAEEARQICDDATELLSRLENGSATSVAIDVAQELEKLFHRLKGSALVVGEAAIHQEAATLQRACSGESASEASSRVVEEGLGRIRAALGSTGSAAAVDRAVERHAVAPVEPELWQAFTQECSELLESLDKIALSLEESDRPREPLKALLPIMHTLKGVVNTMGLVPTGKALHRVEDLLEGLLEATVLPSMRSVATFLLQIQVEVRRNLKQAGKGFVELSLGRIDEQIARVLSGRKAKPVRPSSAGASESALSEHSEASVGGAAASGSGTNAGVDRKFVRVGTDRLDGLMNLAGELVVSRSRLLSRVESLRSLQTELGRGSRRLIETVDKFCDEHEFARVDVTARTFAIAAGAESMSAVARAPRHVAAHVGPSNDQGAWNAFGELELDKYEDIHILSRSLTELTSDFGEMYGQLSQGLAALTDDADTFGGIVGGIQSEVTRARMVPLEVLFSRLRLPVRDAAMRENKDVRVVTRGDEVQLDKTIADALFQPMLHLVRNSVAHGLESASRRDALGKERLGTIELTARQELGQIVLEVRDDGGGLDLARLRTQGIAMGLLAADVPEGDASIKELVFAPGLSTETVARDVAGRGVGCDFVRRAIERLNGSIRVESEAGKFTSFVLTLPLTLAITKALLVKQNRQSFALPLYFAERILDAYELETVESTGLRRVRLEGQWVPVQRLGSFLGQTEGDTGDGPIVVLRVGSERVLVQVDAVIGQEEIVVKSLGAVLTGHPLFAGVTMRGTGQMVLILDVPGLMESRSTRAGQAPKVAPVVDAPRPDAKSTKVTVQRIVAPPAKEESEDAGRLRVMFVDDSLSVRKVAEKALEALGVEVTTAIDGLDALEKMRARTYDLVFTDLEMPRMHGFELIRELRFLTAYQELPIVVVTSRSGQKHQEQARSLGANEYITKPFTPQSLGAAIEKWGRARKSDKGTGR